MKHFYLIVFSFFFVSLEHADAQEVTGVSAAIVDGKLEISYQMVGLKSGQKFDVELFSSVDKFAAPVTEGVEGSLGQRLDLYSQGNKIIIADPLETLGFITNDIQFKVIAHMVRNPVTLNYPLSSFKTKRGKTIEVLWSGGLLNEDVKVNLYRNNSLLIDGLITASNSGAVEFKIPKKQAKGEGYHFELKFASLEEPVKLPDFQIKSKKGWIWLIPIGLAGYITYDIVTEQNGLPSEVARSLGLLDPLPLPTAPLNPDQHNGVLNKSN